MESIKALSNVVSFQILIKTTSIHPVQVATKAVRPFNFILPHVAKREELESSSKLIPTIIISIMVHIIVSTKVITTSIVTTIVSSTLFTGKE